MVDGMERIYCIKKGAHVENMEIFFMYQETKKSNQFSHSEIFGEI
jgi:hypothetical protein